MMDILQHLLTISHFSLFSFPFLDSSSSIILAQVCQIWILQGNLHDSGSLRLDSSFLASFSLLVPVSGSWHSSCVGLRKGGTFGAARSPCCLRVWEYRRADRTGEAAIDDIQRVSFVFVGTIQDCNERKKSKIRSNYKAKRLKIFHSKSIHSCSDSEIPMLHCCQATAA